MAEKKGERNFDVLSLKNHEKLPVMEFLLRFERMFICLLLISPFFFSCKTTTPSAVSEQPQIISHQVPNNHFPPKEPVIRVVISPDSLSFNKKKSDEPDFFRWIENEKMRVIADKEITQLLHYPEEYRDADIEGRWYYDVYFDQQCISSWTLRKGPEGTVLMQKEIERAFMKLQPSLRYFFEEKCSVRFEFIIVLERGY